MVAIVQLDEKVYAEIAKEKGLKGDVQDLAKTPEGKKIILDDLNLAATNGKLKGFERIKDVFVTPDSFEKLGLLTTSFKVKRNETKEHFLDEINKLYEKLN